MGWHLIVLNNSNVAADILEQRSVVYADRVCKRFYIPSTLVLIGTNDQPRFPMVNELCALVQCSAMTMLINNDITGWDPVGPLP